jgi:hypothetical protein
VRPGARRPALLAATLLPLLVYPAAAQEWRAGAHVGQVAYEGAPAGATPAATFMLGLNRLGVRDWLGVSAGLPLGDDPFWGVVAGWRRLETTGRLGMHLDLSGHGFFQWHQVTDTAGGIGGIGPVRPAPTTRSEIAGTGAGAEALAGGTLSAGPVGLQLRGGAAAQTSTLGGVAEQRVLPLADARVSMSGRGLQLSAESRHWWAPEGSHAYAGGAVQLVGGAAHLWASAGSWVRGGTGGVPWSAGAGLALGDRLEIQLAARADAFDPLYRSAAAASYSAGAVVRFGGRATPRAPVPARYDGGRAEIRIPASAAASAPAIAGDFTGWEPRPMRRAGGYWIFTVALEPGVYYYAFVAGDGTWFVPESVPGRQSDGMGGHVAVLVVSP